MKTCDDKVTGGVAVRALVAAMFCWGGAGAWAATAAWTGGDGTWNTPAMWSGATGGGVPGAADNVVIDNAVANSTVTADTDYTTTGTLTVNPGDTILVTAARNLAFVATTTHPAGRPFANYGTIRKTGSGTFNLKVQQYSDTTASINQGVIENAGSGDFEFPTSGGASDFDLNNTGGIIRNTGGGKFPNGNRIITGGLIVNSSGTLATGGNAGYWQFVNAVVSNAATISIVQTTTGGSGNANYMTVNGGVLTNSAPGIVNIFNNSAATHTAATTSALDITGAGSLNNAGTISILDNDKTTATLASLARLTLNTTGMLLNTGTINIQNTASAGGGNTYVYLGRDVQLLGNGNMVLNNSLRNIVTSSTTTPHVLTNGSPAAGNGHTIRGGGSLGNNLLSVVNYGTIEAAQATAALTIDPATDVVNYGTITATGAAGMVLQDGSFGNHGTIRCAGGSSIGYGTGGTTVTNYTDGTIEFEITGASTYGTLSIDGALTAGGTLKVTLNGYTPVLGDTFHVLSFGSIGGAFTTFDTPSLPGGMKWKTDQIAATGSVSVQKDNKDTLITVQ